MTNQKQTGVPSDDQREPDAHKDGEADRSKTKGIPPLPEPDVEGVGNESGPSAGKARPEIEAPDPGDVKAVKDAGGF